jgi:hypothetical protein
VPLKKIEFFFLKGKKESVRVMGNTLGTWGDLGTLCGQGFAAQRKTYAL